jgi:hypothetical protein
LICCWVVVDCWCCVRVLLVCCWLLNLLMIIFYVLLFFWNCCSFGIVPNLLQIFICNVCCWWIFVSASTAIMWFMLLFGSADRAEEHPKNWWLLMWRNRLMWWTQCQNSGKYWVYIV